VKIDVDGHSTTNCGYMPDEKMYRGQQITVNFMSDDYSSEMGFWLMFAGK